MPTTYRTDIVNRIKYQLKDASNAVFPTPDIDPHLSDAVVEVSETSPNRKKETLTFASATRDLDLSTLISSVLYVDRIEYPIAQNPRKFANFTRWGNTLTLEITATPASGATAYAYCEEVHTLTDATCTMDSLQQALVTDLGAARCAIAQARGYINKANVGGDNVSYALLKWGENKLAETRRRLRRLKQPQQRQDYNE